jgi:hypothetical protein
VGVGVGWFLGSLEKIAANTRLVASVVQNTELKSFLKQTTHVYLIVAPSPNLSLNLVNMFNDWRCMVCFACVTSIYTRNIYKNYSDIYTKNNGLFKTNT